MLIKKLAMRNLRFKSTLSLFWLKKASRGKWRSKSDVRSVADTCTWQSKFEEILSTVSTYACVDSVAYGSGRAVEVKRGGAVKGGRGT